jgi:predicted nucleic acid-binding protein
VVFLIDTDVMIDVSRENSAAAAYVDSIIDPAISIITAQELIVGAKDNRDLRGIDSLVTSYPVIHIDAAIGQLAYDLLKRFAGSHGLRTFDSLIAATAIERDCTLVSRSQATVPASVHRHKLPVSYRVVSIPIPRNNRGHSLDLFLWR